MKKWTSIIVDDEPLARLELKRLLKVYDQISIIGESDSVHSAKEIIVEQKPDLVFLDIDLGTKSGFDLLEIIPVNFRVIFVTAFDEFAIRAFKVNALDYLLKPVHPERLKETISRLGNPFVEDVNFLLEPFDKILVTLLKCSRFVTVSSIIYIEAKGDYTQLVTIDGHTGIVHHSIKKWLSRLPSNMFSQVHRSFIVNIDHIKELKKKNKDSFDIYFERTAKKIPVSRNFSKEIKSRFELK